MRLEFVEIKNFRKLQCCRIDLSDNKSVFVGANNSGKTSAMDALSLFLKARDRFSTRDFTLSNWKSINMIGYQWLKLEEGQQPDLSITAWEDFIPQMDVWISILPEEVHYVSHLIPTLSWNSHRIGVRLRLEPTNVELLYKDFVESYVAARKMTETAAKKLRLWPKTLWDYLEKKMSSHFSVSTYILDESKLTDPIDGKAQPQALNSLAKRITGDPFAGLVKIDIINAQRGFSDPNSETNDRTKTTGNLTHQLREYFNRHLNPVDKPEIADLEALQAMEDARETFDGKLLKSFNPSLEELKNLNYPGFGGNPGIKISSRISALDGLNHASAVQFELMKADGTGDHPWGLPEKYNGLGYQNLISMVFKLIRFRDEWMQVGKLASASPGAEDAPDFQPLHLVLIEEPEAHLHAQVQQVFMKKAYHVLRNNTLLEKYKHFSTQMVVSTHSNHIAFEIPFTALRYFRRHAAPEGGVPTSTVTNLHRTFGTEDDTTKFAARYLRTTHGDLFFADAVILVEGQAERMLVPHFIQHKYPHLSSCYIAILEIGGSHAHTLRPLLQDLGIITLIITDLDPVDASNHNTSKYPTKGKKLVTGNKTLSGWVPAKELIDELCELNTNALTISGHVRVAFQQPISVKFEKDDNEVEIIPSTFEVALAFDNIDLFKSLKGKGLIAKIKEALNGDHAAEAGQKVYEAVRNSNKGDFALNLLFLEDPSKLKVPTYIAAGLDWLQEQLNPVKS
jgi:predicted ATP-dependent endonuclease of OLD family